MMQTQLNNSSFQLTRQVLCSSEKLEFILVRRCIMQLEVFGILRGFRCLRFQPTQPTEKPQVLLHKIY